MIVELSFNKQIIHTAVGYCVLSKWMHGEAQTKKQQKQHTDKVSLAFVWKPGWLSQHII